MTVQEQDLVQYYDGPISSGTVLSIVEFTFLENSHVAAKIRGLSDNLVYGTDYTVSGMQSLNRTITLLTDIADTEVLAVFLDVPITQGVSPEEGGNMPAATQEYSLDKLTQICAKLYERITRSFQASIDSTFDGTLYGLNDNSGKALIVNATGTGVTYSEESLDNIVSAVEALTDEAEGYVQDASNSASAAAQSAVDAQDQVALATTQANLAQGYAQDASDEADRAEAAASSLATVVPITGDEGKFLQVETPYTSGYKKLSPQELAGQLSAITYTKNSVNSAKVNASGYADFMSAHTYNNNTAWTQPVLTSNTSFGTVTAKEEYSTFYAWRALDGIKSGTSNPGWVTSAVLPSWWNWALPYAIKISQIKYYNRDDTTNFTTTFRIWTDSTKTTPLTDVITAVRSAWGLSTITLSTPVITNNIYLEILSGDNYAGIGELEITAVQPDSLSPTSVTHYAGGSNPNIVETDVLGRTHTITADETITGMTNNGTYEMLKEYDLATGNASASTPIATLKLVTEVQTLPSVSTALNGNYYTVTGVQPNRQYKVVAGAYVETTFVRRGQATKTAGTMGTPVSRPFNYNPYGNALKNTWVSGEYAIVANTVVSATHNLNLPEPLLAKGEVLIKCVIAELGYSVGDYAVPSSASSSVAPIPLTLDSKTAKTSIASSCWIANKSTATLGNCTLANWRYVFKINY